MHTNAAALRRQPAAAPARLSAQRTAKEALTPLAQGHSATAHCSHAAKPMHTSCRPPTAVGHTQFKPSEAFLPAPPPPGPRQPARGCVTVAASSSPAAASSSPAQSSSGPARARGVCTSQTRHAALAWQQPQQQSALALCAGGGGGGGGGAPRPAGVQHLRPPPRPPPPPPPTPPPRARWGGGGGGGGGGAAGTAPAAPAASSSKYSHAPPLPSPLPDLLACQHADPGPGCAPCLQRAGSGDWYQAGRSIELHAPPPPSNLGWWVPSRTFLGQLFAGFM